MATWTPDYNPNMGMPEGGFTVGQLLSPNYLSYQVGQYGEGSVPETRYHSLDLNDAEGSFAAISPGRSLRQAISDVAPGFQLPAGGPIDWGSVLNSRVEPGAVRKAAGDPLTESLITTGASFFIGGLPGMMGDAGALASLWDNLSGLAGGGAPPMPAPPVALDGTAMPPAIVDTNAISQMAGNLMPPAILDTAGGLFNQTSPGLVELASSFSGDSSFLPPTGGFNLTNGSFNRAALGSGLASPTGAGFSLNPSVYGGPAGSGLSSLFEGLFGQMDPDLKKKLGLGMGGASALLSLLSAGMGLKGAKDIRAAASDTPQMAPIYDPFASQRGFYQQQLQGLASDPSKVFELPGYKAGEQALMRQLAAGGYLGSGNMAVALRDYGTKAYGEEFDRLAGLAGAKIGPMVAGSAPNPYVGAVAANDATSKALASLGYLARMW